MSREIDEKVVSMKFDNANFEKNVKVSMSTIEKLKTALIFKGVSEGFDKITGAAKKVTLDPISKSVEEVGVKFNAFYSIADQALRNITNSAVNAGKQLVKSLSIDQVTAGYSKYESMTGNVQTLVNSTGKSVEEINEYLEELMWFSDETSYSFTDMTSALSTMVSSGGDIDKLIPMIMGIANATAYAGKGSAEFNRAIYNLSQAYGTGALQLVDWKSVQNAGVNSKGLIETLIKAGEEAETISKGAVTLSNFNESLEKKWITKEVMENAFGEFSALMTDVYAHKDDFDSTAEAIDGLSDSYSEMTIRATKSAQEAKSFTEAIDATKDAVSSGWMRTFQLIFGNYNQATRTWTDVTNNLWDIFAEGGESRNEQLEKIFTSNWERVTSKITEAGGEISVFEDKIKEVAESSGVDIYSIIDDVGSLENAFGQGLLSADLITKAIEDMGVVTKSVTKTVDLSVDDINKSIEHVNSKYKNFMDFVKEYQNKFFKAGEDGSGRMLVGTMVERGAFLQKAGFVENYEEIARLISDITASEDYASGVMTEKYVDAVRKAGAEIVTNKLNLMDFTDEELKLIGVNEKYINSATSMQQATDKFGRAVRDIFKGSYDNAEENMKKMADLGYDVTNKYLESEIAEYIEYGDDIEGLDPSGYSRYGLDFAKSIGYMQNSLISAGVQTEAASDKLKEFQTIFDSIWRGDFGNGIDRYNKLTAAGYKYNEVQGLVNKHAAGYKLTLDDLDIALTANAKSQLLQATTHVEVTETISEENAAMKELLAQTGMTDTEISKFLADINKPSAKMLVADIINNSLSGIYTTLQGLKTAFSESFPSDKAEILYNILTKIRDVTQKLVIDIENEDGIYTEAFRKIVRTFKTISSAAKIVGKVIKTAFTTAIKIVNRLLGNTEDSEKSILDMTASFGDWMTKLADWIDENQVIEKFFNTIYDLFDKFMNKFDKVKATVLESSVWQTFIEWFSKGKNAIKDFIENFDGLSSIKSFFDNLKFDTSKITGPLALLKAPLIAIFGKEGESEISFTYFKDNLVKLTDDVSGILKTFKDDFNSANEKVEEFKTNTDDSLEVVSSKTTVLGSVISNLKDKLIDFYDKFKTAFSQTGSIFNDITEWIKDNQGGILVIGFSISIIATLITVSNAVSKMTGAINKLLGPINSITGLVDSFKKSLDSATSIMKTKAKTAKMEAFGRTVAIIAASIVGVLTSIMIIAKMAKNGTADFDKAMEILGFIALSIGALMLVASASVKGMGSGAKLEVSIKGMAGIAAAIGVLAASVILMAKQASKDLTAFKTAAVVMIGLAIILGGMLYAVTGANALIKSSPKFMNVVGTLIKIAESLAILAISCTLMALVDSSKLETATGMMAILALILSGMVALIYVITDKLGKNVDRFMAVSGTIIGMAIAIAVLATSLIPIAIIPQKKIWNAVGVVAVLGLVIAAMVALAIVASKTGGALSGAGTVIAMAASVLIMAIAVKKIAGIPENDLIKAMTVVAGLYLFMIGFMVLSEFAGTDVKSVGILFIGLGVAIMSIAYAMRIISKLSAGEIAKGIATVAAVITLMSGFMVLSRFAGKEGGGSAALILIGLGASLILVAGALLVISKIDPDRLLAAVVSLGILMGILAADLLAVKNLGSDKALATLIGLAVCIALIATAMAILAKMSDAKTLLGTATSLSLVLLTMAGAIWIIGEAKFNAKILITVGVIMAVIAVIALIFAMMSALDVKDTLTNAIALSLVLTTMVAACILLQLANGVMPLAYAALGVMTLCVASIALILAMMTALGVENALENAAALSLLVISLSASCVLLAVVGLTGPAALTGVLALGALIIELGALMAGIGKLMELCPELQGFVEKAIPLLGLIGEGLGSFFGNLIGGFLEAVGSGIMVALNEVAAGLITFGTSMSIFGNLISGIDPSVWDGVKSMAEAILILTAADMLDGIRKFFGGDQTPPLVKFAAELALAAPYLATYSAVLTAGHFNGAVVEASGSAIKMLAEAAKALPREGGLWQKIAGTAKSMGEFAEELTIMAPALVSYSDCLEQNPIDTEAIQASADAIKALADVAKEMPKDGGILQDVIGHTQTLASFTAQLVGNNRGGKGVADYLVEYSNFLVSNPIDSKAISGSADAIKAMVDVANAIGATGGIWQTIVGDKTSLKDFMAMFAGTDGVGAHIKDFANKMGVTDLESATAGATVLDTLIGVFNGMEATGGIFAIFSGDDNNQFKKFHQDLPALGTDLNMFSTNLGKFSPTFTGYAMTFLTELFGIKNVTSKSVANLGDLGESLTSLADGLIDISDASSGANLDYLIESLENIISVIDKTLSNASNSFNTAGGTIISNISQGMNGKKATLANKMGDLLTAVKDKITNYLANYYAQGKNIATKVGAGINDTTNLKNVNADVDTFVTKIHDRLCNEANVDKMKDAGKNCVLGFAEGFKDNDANDAVVDAVTKMAEKPGQITKTINQIMSPSHLFNSMARFCVLGFAGGFEENAYLVDKPVEDMSSSAVNVLQSAISKIHELLISGFDSDPTIRPVMDLSNVEDGIGTLKNLSRGIYGLGGSNTMAFDVSGRINQNRKNESINNSDLNKSQNNTSTVNNTFYITGTNADDIADKVSNKIQRSMEREVAVWA